MDAKALSRFGRAMSSEMRVRILRTLSGRALCVGALAARLGITQGAVSQHLHVLREANLVAAEKRGYYVHYRLNKESMATARDAVGRLLETPGKKGARGCPITRRPTARNRKN